MLTIHQRFLRSLLHVLVLHLRVTTFHIYGRQLYITPFNALTLMRVRQTLSWMEGNRMLGLDYWEVLHLFKVYCRRYYPFYYDQRQQGIELLLPL